VGFPNSFVFGGLLQRQPELQAHGQSGFPPPAFDQSATFRLFPTTYNRRIVLRLARFMPDTLQRYPKRYRPRISSVPPILQPRFIPDLSKAWSHSNAREMLMQPRLFAISGHRLAFRLSQPASMRVPRPSSAWAGDHEARSFAHHCLLFSLKTRCSGTARIMPTAVCRNQCIGLFRPPGSALVRQSSRMMFEHLFDHRPRGFHRVLAGK